MAPALSKEFLEIHANSRVRINSGNRTSHDHNIQLKSAWFVTIGFLIIDSNFKILFATVVMI